MSAGDQRGLLSDEDGADDEQKGTERWVVPDVDLGDSARDRPRSRRHHDVLAWRVPAVPDAQIGADLAGRLTQRFQGMNVTNDNADSAALPDADATSTGTLSFTMLHQFPTIDLQDRLLRGIRRVLKPRRLVGGSARRARLVFRLAHVADTTVHVDRNGFVERRVAAGFQAPEVLASKSAFRFRVRVPASVAL